MDFINVSQVKPNSFICDTFFSCLSHSLSNSIPANIYIYTYMMCMYIYICIYYVYIYINK